MAAITIVDRMTCTCKPNCCVHHTNNWNTWYADNLVIRIFRFLLLNLPWINRSTVHCRRPSVSRRRGTNMDASWSDVIKFPANLQTTINSHLILASFPLFPNSFLSVWSVSAFFHFKCNVRTTRPRADTYTRTRGQRFCSGGRSGGLQRNPLPPRSPGHSSWSEGGAGGFFSPKLKAFSRPWNDQKTWQICHCVN